MTRSSDAGRPLGGANTGQWRVETGPYQEQTKRRGLVIARWEGLDYITQPVGVLHFPNGLTPDPTAPFEVEIQLANGYTKRLKAHEYPTKLRPFVLAYWKRLAPTKDRDDAPQAPIEYVAVCTGDVVIDPLDNTRRTVLAVSDDAVQFEDGGTMSRKEITRDTLLLPTEAAAIR